MDIVDELTAKWLAAEQEREELRAQLEAARELLKKVDDPCYVAKLNTRFRDEVRAFNASATPADSAPVAPARPANGKNAIEELTELLRAAGLRPYWNASPKGCTCPFPRDKCPDCASPCDECRKAQPDPGSRDVWGDRLVLIESNGRDHDRRMRQLADVARLQERAAQEAGKVINGLCAKVGKLESEVHKTTTLALELSGAVTRLEMKVAELENKAEARRELAEAAGRVSAASRTELRQRIEALEAMPWNAAGLKPAPPAPVAVPEHLETCDSLELGPELEPSTKPCNCKPYKPETAGPGPHARSRRAR